MAKDPYRYFRVEARELLEGLGQGALRLEKQGGGDAVALLLRLAHTLKGAARVVRQVRIAELAHAVEDVLAPYRAGERSVPHERIDDILRLLDAISTEVAALGPALDPAREAPTPPAPEELFERVRVELGDMDALLDQVSETGVQLARLRQETDAIARARQLTTAMAGYLSARSGAGATTLTRMRSYVEELQGHLDGVERNLVRAAEQVDRALVQVGETANRLRLVPVSAVFPPLERAARDAAQALGQRIEFTASGGDMRLHADVLAAVRDALLQVVRNAVAHGIEPEAERVAAGKPPVGRVTLQVARTGSRLVFRCRDDGRGIDQDAVRRAAVRGGMSTAEAQSLAPEQVTELLLRSGMTTAGTVTEMSGRGVGLDVVRETAGRLKAELKLSSAPGHGTTVELSVPVSLAALVALLVESAGVTVALPLEAVRGAVRLADHEIARSGGRESILHEGGAIPLQPLAPLLHRGAGGRSCSAVVVRAGDDLAAIGVDRLLGTMDVVVRPLPRLAEADPIVTGVWLDSTGDPQLVLDPEGLVAAARVGQRPSASTASSPRSPILVVDDSLTTRMLEQSILESAGYQVELAVSAEEAFDKARARRYGVFLVDIEMPGMDGFEFVARTRADPILRDTPAVLVSSRSSAEDRERGAQAGARAYIVKSEFDQGSFLEVIRELVV